MLRKRAIIMPKS